MKQNLNSTNDNMFELNIIFCDKTNEFKVHKDSKTRVFEDIIDIALQKEVPVRIIKREPICSVCKEPLACNGTKSIQLNKNVLVKCQKYIHKKNVRKAVV